METLNFGSFYRAINGGTATTGNKELFDALIEPIISNANVLNESGELYYFDDAYAKKFIGNKENFPRTIVKATENSKIVSDIETSFNDVIIPDFLTVTKESNAYDSLVGIINTDASIGPSKRDELLTLYRDGDFGGFLAQTFIYAMQCKNKLKNEKRPTFDKEFQELNTALNKFPTKVKLTPPSNLEDHELTYVSELLAAYSEDANKDYQEVDDLDGKYRDNFIRQRNDYYNAESVRVSARDVYNSADGNMFEEFKEETYDGIIDYVEDDYDNGFKRLKEVTKQAGKLSYSKSILPSIPKWIGPSEKKGTCHMLVNDKKFKWVDEDDD